MSDPRRAAAAAVAGAGSTGLGAAIERWALPEVAGPVIGARPRDERKAAAAAAAAAEAIALIARQESEQRGYEEGLARAQPQIQARLAELDQRVQQLDAVLQVLGRPLRELDVQVEKDLMQLALAIGKQLARRELRIDPAQVIAIIRESLTQLPSAARDVRVHLHPEDAAVVRERLATPTHEKAWTLVEDPTLSRGGCVVRAEQSQVDARLESRINTIVAATLGDDRAVDRQAAAATAAPMDEPASITAPAPGGSPASPEHTS